MKLLFVSLFFSVSLWRQQKISLKTQSGDSITVVKEIIYYNNKPISKTIEKDIVYNSKYNRLIEQGGTILLFLEMDGRPDYNYLEAFRITKQKATDLVACVYNDNHQRHGPAPFTDMDNDGKLEFGGFDLTEGYAAEDSMYYCPSKYYEISHGNIVFDSALTKKMDLKENGIYLPKPLDKDGNCCVVIKKPGNTNSR